MSFRILIDHTKLTDSPYSKASESLYDFTSSDTDGFVQDIINGNPTCYLISGYRGSGKSSFVKKLEEIVKNRDNRTLFVYLNFAKHEERSILLRKLIRNFYLSAVDNKVFQELQKVEDVKCAINEFKDLYERTFYEVSKNTNERKVRTTTSVFGYNGNLKDILFVCFSAFALIAFVIGLDLTKLYNYIPVGSALLLSVFGFYSVGKKKVNEDVNTNEVSKNSFYDDEIAEHYLLETLKSFQKYIRIVFILDELDKIEDDQLVENLINELKPVMLSGLASFIAVAGQNLYYNYYVAQTRDDSALSSLFAKAHHVPLFSTSELRILFRKIISNNGDTSGDNKELLDAYEDYLIFESKRVPRRFIINIRQSIVWENNQSFLEIEKPLSELNIYSKILKRIETIDDKEIATKGYPEPIRDYFNMQLLLTAHRILKSQHLVFTQNEILNGNGN